MYFKVTFVLESKKNLPQFYTTVKQQEIQYLSQLNLAFSLLPLLWEGWGFVFLISDFDRFYRNK